MSDTEQDIFASATQDEPAQAEPAVVESQVEQQPSETEKVRDDRGRFAAKSEDQEPKTDEAKPAQAEPQGQNEAHVPSWRLREEREAREARERELGEARQRLQAFERQQQDWQRQQQQPQSQQPPDIFQDPDGYRQFMESSFTSRLEQARQQDRFNYSEDRARDKFGDARVDEVKSWIAERANDRAIEARVLGSRHPYGEMVKLYEEQKLLSEIGSDPEAWRQAEREKLRAELAAEQQQQANPSPKNVTRLPPSLNRQTSAASIDGGDDGSEEAIWAHGSRRR